jgi:hypothetical protein
LDAVSLPKPQPGLVIRYSYLWQAEHREGREEGVKDRPCAIVLTVESHGPDKRPRVVVLPITHTPPADSTFAVEIPLVTKNRLGLDDARSWVILSESNEFLWPGPDLRRSKGKDDNSVAYGFLPPTFYAEVKRRFVVLAEASKSVTVKRTE